MIVFDHLKKLKLCLVIENYFVRITLVWKWKKLIKSCIWTIAVCGSETGTLGKQREGLKCIWNMELERNVKNKMDRIKNCEVFQRTKEEITLQNFKK